MNKKITTPRGYLYVCKCGYEKRLITLCRGVPCANCEGSMKLKRKGE